MRSKSLNPFWLSLIFALAPVTTFATVTVTPFVPNRIVTYGGENTVYYADSTSTDAANFYLDGRAGYTAIDFDSLSYVLNFTVAGLTATNRYLYVFSEGTSASSYYSVPIGNCTYGTCTQYQLDAAGNTQVQVGIAPGAICNPTYGGSSSAKGCLASAVDRTTLPFPGVRLRFVVTSATSAGAVTATEKGNGALIQIFPEQAGPRLTGCPESPGFFPGDGSILVDTTKFTAVPDSTAGGSSNTYIKVFVVAQKNAALPADYTTADFFSSVDFGTGSTEVSPFENSTNGTLVPYTVDYGVEDSAGIIAFCGSPPAGSSTPSGATYPLTNVFATDIQGFLRESNCFVATASYRDGRAPGVMLLRHFRDEILSRSEIGRDFISWYYTNGPIAADWLIERPIFRSAVLMVLLPLQALAWVALYPSALLLPLFALLVLLLALLPRRGVLSAILFTSFSLSSPARAVDQPYIDSLISELPTQTTESYTKSVRKKIGPGEDSTGYTEEMRKQIAPRDGSEGYADRIQKGLPKTTGSAIEDYRNGKKLGANKGNLDTRSAFGFNILAGANRTYTAGANQDVAYETVYGNKWIPDFTLHYEWRPFTGDFIKKFGIYGSVGGSFTKANGILNYEDSRFGNQSRTEFKFIMLPVNAGLIYRFNLFDFMWPYFGGGPSAIGYIESRNDKQGSNRGYGFGYWFTGGLAFGMDWLSPKASWDQYESTGVKHTYFTIDYSYLESIAGGLVEFTVDGVQLGFTFEL